jgi:uncharacterized caspase-like protein
MRRTSKILSVFAILACVLLSNTGVAAAEKRLALVIGNAAYKAQPLVTAVNDAALISQTLQLAGFDVTGARDLDQSLLRDAFRNFTKKVANAGADAVAFVYFAGYGVQLAGDNYLIPVGVEISNVSDIPARMLSLSELMHTLSALGPKSTFIVLDVGRPGPFILAGQAGGLAWTEPDTNTLIAFSTAPGTSARDTAGSYGAYAKALAEMIREGGLTPTTLFDRVRLRVHGLTAGAQVPWDASKIETPFKFFERAPSAPARTDAPLRAASLRMQPMRVLGAQNAYTVALLRDTFDAYTDFLADYWQDPMTKRVRALLAARRESITWERTSRANEPAAYWSYLEVYPKGPHVAEAARGLTKLGAATTPPAKFARMDYDVPPPLPDELDYIERPMLALDDPAFGFEPPLPTSADFLEPPSQELANLKTSPVSAAHDLPVLNLPLQAFLRVPPEVKASSNSTGETHDAWTMRPAVDAPTVSETQADATPVSPIPASNSQNDIASPKSDGARNPGVRSGDQAAANEATSRRLATPVSGNGSGEDTSLSNSTRQIASTMPTWLIDLAATMRNANASLKSSLIGGDATSGPSAFSPASASLAFQTWLNGIGSEPKTSRASLPVARPASPAPPQARSAAQSPASQISPSRATGSIARSTPPSATSAPAGSRIRSKPSVTQLEPPSISADQMKPRKRPPTAKPPPSTQSARNPGEQQEATPPNSQ